MDMTRCKRGFTLVELLITTAILGIVTLAIFSTFASGLNVYTRVRSYTGLQPDILFSLEKIERDLRGAFVFSKIDFRGEKKLISFPAIVNNTGSKKEEVCSLGRVTYYYDGVKDILIREEQDYSKAIKGKYRKRGKRTTLASLKNMEFSYFYYDTESKAYNWVNSWKMEKLDDDEEETKDPEKKGLWTIDDKILLGAKVEVEFRDGRSDRTLSRTVFFPAAGSYHRNELIAALGKD